MNLMKFSLKFTSFYSNYIRGDLRGIYYLDHCIYSEKKLLEEIGLVPEIDIFEDTAICIKLRKLSKWKRLDSKSTTSAIRFNKNGFWKQALLNAKLKLKYSFGVFHEDLNKDYEKKMDLNSKYE